MQYFHIPSCVRVSLGYSQPSSASHFASYLLGGATHSMRDGFRRGMARELANNKSAFAIECDLSILSSTWLPYYYHYYNPPDCRSISVSPSESAATVRWYNHTPSITFLSLSASGVWTVITRGLGCAFIGIAVTFLQFHRFPGTLYSDWNGGRVYGYQFQRDNLWNVSPGEWWDEKSFGLTCSQRASDVFDLRATN